MRKTKRSGGFFLCLIFNMLLNLEWTIPAWVLLAMHYLFGWSIWWFWLALCVWLLDVLFWMHFMGWATRCGNTPDPQKANKNPYSVKKIYKKEDESTYEVKNDKD